jgi:hypothetical protein
LAVALVLAPCAAAAQDVYRHVDTAGRVSFTDHPDLPIVARELEPLPVAPASAVREAGPKPSVRGGAIDRREANRRLLQAERELARGPDMQQGIPPSTEARPGDRRKARVKALERSVEAARLRAREVNGTDHPAEFASR